MIGFFILGGIFVKTATGLNKRVIKEGAPLKKEIFRSCLIVGLAIIGYILFFLLLSPFFDN
jgi:hypothetical protein